MKLVTSIVAVCVLGLLPCSVSAVQSNDEKSDKSKTVTEEKIPVNVENGVAKIDASNTQVNFVGTHVGSKPNPRYGGFKTFSGEIKIDQKTSELDSISVTFEAESIWTEFGNLTRHLKNADFFNVKKYPEIKFKSTTIKSVKDHQYKVVGEMTMLGVTKKLTFPVNIELKEDQFSLSGSFDFDRTEFGMTKLTAGVEKQVSVEVQVGKKTTGKRKK